MQLVKLKIFKFSIFSIRMINDKHPKDRTKYRKETLIYINRINKQYYTFEKERLGNGGSETTTKNGSCNLIKYSRKF